MEACPAILCRLVAVHVPSMPLKIAMNALHPSQMTGDERLAEFGQDCPASASTLRPRKSSSLSGIHRRSDELQRPSKEATCPAAGAGRQA